MMVQIVRQQFKVEVIIRLIQLLFIASVIIMFYNCGGTKPVTTTTYTKVDTTYRDTTIYNYIKRDSTIIKQYEVYKDTTIYKDSIAYRIRTKFTGLIYMAPVEDSVGLAYAKAWVDASVLYLLVVQRDSAIAIKLDSAIMQIHIKDSIITELQTKYDKHASVTLRWKYIKDTFLYILILAGLIVIWQVFKTLKP